MSFKDEMEELGFEVDPVLCRDSYPEGEEGNRQHKAASKAYWRAKRDAMTPEQKQEEWNSSYIQFREAVESSLDMFKDLVTKKCYEISPDYDHLEDDLEGEIDDGFYVDLSNPRTVLRMAVQYTGEALEGDFSEELLEVITKMFWEDRASEKKFWEEEPAVGE